MKKHKFLNTLSTLFTLFVLLTGTLPLSGQSDSIIVYGFVSTGSSESLTLQAVDAINGGTLNTYSINDYNAYAVGSSTFDQINENYIFIGVNNSSTFRVPSFNLEEETIVSEPQLEATVNDFQYDMNSMNLYGMGNYVVDSIQIGPDDYQYEYASRFLQVNSETGELNNLNNLPNLRAFPVGGSTFDANGGRYIVNGYDANFMERLFIIEAATGTIISDLPFSFGANQYLNELEYNNNDDKLYGLYRDLSTNLMQLVSVDLATNDITPVFTIEDLQYFSQGASVFHQASQSFILYYIDFNNLSRLLVIDVVNQTMVANHEVDYFTELEINNSRFARLQYQSTTGLDDQVDQSLLTLFPNPVGSELRFQANEPIEKIEIYSITGQKLLMLPSLNNVSLSVSVDALPKGIYTAVVQTVNTQIKRQFIKN